MLDWHSVCFCSAKRAFLNVKSQYTTGNLNDDLILSAELIMYIGHRKEFLKPTFREKSANDLVILRKTQHTSLRECIWLLLDKFIRLLFSVQNTIFLQPLFV